MKRYSLLLMVAALLMAACEPELTICEILPGPGGETGLGENLVVFPSVSSTAKIVFESAKPWTIGFVSGGDGWLSVSDDQGPKGLSEVTLSAEQNDTFEERSSIIVFKSEDMSWKYIVAQKQNDAVILSRSVVDIDAEPAPIELRIRHNVDYQVNIEPDAKSWIRRVETRAVVEDVLQFQADSNEGRDPRTGHITVTAEGITETLTVRQQGLVPTIIMTGSEYVLPPEGGPLRIDIVSNIAVEMISGGEWLSAVPTKSLAAGTFWLSAEPNPYYKDRSCEVVFRNVEDGLEETVTVIEEAKLREEMLPGVFTLDPGADGVPGTEDDVRVRFARGNLQYQASTDTWRIAAHQFDFIGNAPGNTTEESLRATQSDWIDLFGWGATGMYADGAKPYTTIRDNVDYYKAFTVPGFNGLPTLAGESEWGYCLGGESSPWRTVGGGFYGEWHYLFMERTASPAFGADAARFAKIRIGDVKGLLLFPDEFAVPEGLSVDESFCKAVNRYYYDSFAGPLFVEIDFDSWLHLEEAGCVLLPCAGSRIGVEVPCSIDENGFRNFSGSYWSRTGKDLGTAYGIMFDEYGLGESFFDGRSRGSSVRLVAEQP